MVNSYDHIIVPPLTKEEERLPYASFYYRPVPKPEQRILEALRPENRKPSSWGIPAQEFERILRPEPLENGWCVMPDGSGFSMVTVKMPGITEEMIQFWNGWFHTADIHYKIWFPGFHMKHVETMIEDLGWGMTRGEPAGFVNLKEIRLSAPPDQLDPAFYSNETVSGTMYLLEGEEEEPFASTLAHQLTRTDTGFQMRLAAWSGIHILHGRVIRTSDKPVAPERIRLFAMHNAYEFTRMAEMLPDLWKYSLNIH